MNWLKRQNGSEMKQDQDSIYTRFTTSVAAAAFAIHSLKEAEILKNKNGNKKEDATNKLPNSRQSSFKKTKNEDNINWLKRQNGSEMKQDQDSMNTTFTTAAAAAAAFTIHSLEEAETLKNKNGNKKDATNKLPNSRQSSFTKTKNGDNINWLKRQNGSEMKQDQDSMNTTFTTAAAAAAAFTIHSLEEAETLKNKNGNKKDATNKLPNSRQYSFKETKNGDNMNWLKRQNGSEMKQDQDSINTRFTTAVAAAAFTIHSLEEAETLKNKNGNKKEDATNKLPHSRQSSFEKTKYGGENLMKQSISKNHEALERAYSSRKPSISSSIKLKDAPGKAERNEKLKSLIAWANAEKMKLKHKMEWKKD